MELNDNMKSVIRWGVLTDRFLSTYTVTVAIESLHEDLVLLTGEGVNKRTVFCLHYHFVVVHLLY